MRQEPLGTIWRSGAPAGSKRAPEGLWLGALRRYVVASALGHLAWELAQLPLYTIWYQGSAGEIGFAVAHCTAGDLLIASTALLGATMLFGNSRWPASRFYVVGAATVLGGVLYTVFSEWLNTEVRGGWTYAELMPTLPLVGTGISPLAQWIFIPCAALWWARRPTLRVSKMNEGVL